ncbi:MAG: DUF4214 domain-containing protein [Candidatus Competibacteraceae bacterium]|nr:DUF4214 domain-containing protein [Candidatus Competibacteraceae bacterium]
MKSFLHRFMGFCLLASTSAVLFAQSALNPPCEPFYNLDANGHETAPSECAIPLYTFNNLPVSLVRGTPQPFTRPEGGTHWYEAVYLPNGGLNWLQARALAEEAGGYLATITSSAEGEYIFSLIDDPKYWYQWDSTHNYVMSGPFLGGYQPGQSAEPSGGWRWVSGEAFAYTHWCRDGIEGDQDPRNNNQPNDASGGQDVIAFGEVNIPVSYWGDFPHSVGGLDDKGSDTKVYGFIIEYDANPLPTYALTVAKTGGNGVIVSDPASIHCGATCTAHFNSGDSVTLTATPDAGYSVSGWSGDCAGTSNRCTLTMDAAKNVTALFANIAPTTYPLTTHTAGTGSGVVTGAGNYEEGATVVLTATPDEGSTFVGWSPEPCASSFTMPAHDLICTATFDQAPQDPVTILITHYYTSILDREPEAGGLAYWQNLVAEKQVQDLDVKVVFRDMANFFFNSAEYLDRNTPDDEFITNLYLTFFQREPDQGGYVFWLEQLAKGMTRNQAMAGFLYSSEFTQFMESLGF